MKNTVPEWPAEIVKELRIDAGLTQRQLSTKAGLHENTVGKMERGEYCTISSLEALLDALGYELEVVKK